MTTTRTSMTLAEAVSSGSSNQPPATSASAAGGEDDAKFSVLDLAKELNRIRNKIHPECPETWDEASDMVKSWRMEEAERLTAWLARRGAQSSQPVADQWQSIETAPRDGTAVDLWAQRDKTKDWERYTDCWWGRKTWGTQEYGDACWCGLPDQYSTFEVTHWRPVPPSPGDGHASDCATHNAPAYPSGPCDCGAQPAPAPSAAPGEVSEAVAKLRHLLLQASDGPWESDSLRTEGGDGVFDARQMFDAHGWTIFDSLNSNTACLEGDSDEDGHLSRWDETAKRNFAFIEAARNYLPAILDHLEAAAKVRPQAVRDDGALDTQSLAEAFCAWPLPHSVCADGCATDPSHPHPRSGTNLLTVGEAKQMFDHLLSEGLLQANGGLGTFREIKRPSEVSGATLIDQAVAMAAERADDRLSFLKSAARQSAPGEVSEAEVTSAVAAWDASQNLPNKSSAMRRALEAAAKVRPQDARVDGADVLGEREACAKEADRHAIGAAVAHDQAVSAKQQDIFKARCGVAQTIAAAIRARSVPQPSHGEGR